MALLLIVPVCMILWLMRNQSLLHTIRFPKSAGMTHLRSKKAERLVSMTKWMEYAVIMGLIIAISQPQIIKANHFQTKKGIDIVAILDTSKSMTAEDFKPKNRMAVAKDTLKEFIKKRKNDRLGLIAFGSDAITKAPITYDHSIINHHISNLSIGEAGDGTAIGLAIATGINRLNQSLAKSKIMILITDGVNTAGQIDPISATKIAIKKGIKIYCIGIGTKEGAPIPIHHQTYGKRYARHPNGQLILTTFDDTILKKIASMTNARYFNATNSSELKDVYKEINELEKSIVETSKSVEIIELFPFIIAVIASLFLIKEAIAIRRLTGVKT